MADAFLGDIKLVAFSFAPKNWALCNGQLMSVNQNQALFALLGTTYGGNGTTNFALPNLQARIPLSMGNGYGPGAEGGEAAHTLLVGEIPAHTHTVNGDSTAATTSAPSLAVLAQSKNTSYGPGVDLPMNPATALTAGKSLAHLNMPPFLTLNFIICLAGIFPSRT
jgi:microcystin-dependent protein